MIPNEEEFKMWIVEQKERRTVLEQELGEVHKDLINMMMEKAVPPFHYWMQDKQKEADKVMGEMFEDNTPSMVHVLVKDGKKQTYPKKDALKALGLRWDGAKRGWAGDVPSSEINNLKAEGFNVFVG